MAEASSERRRTSPGREVAGLRSMEFLKRSSEGVGEDSSWENVTEKSRIEEINKTIRDNRSRNAQESPAMMKFLKLPLQVLGLKNTPDPMTNFLAYRTWRAQNRKKYLFVEWFDVEPDLQKKNSTLRSFMLAWCELLENERIDRIRYLSAGTNGLHRLFEKHGLAKRIPDPFQASMLEKLLPSTSDWDDERYYEGSSESFIAWTKKYFGKDSLAT